MPTSSSILLLIRGRIAFEPHLVCDPTSVWNVDALLGGLSNLRKHEALHESSDAWTIVCAYADCATDAAEQGGALWERKRFPLQWKLEYHIRRGLRTHLQTEEQIAYLFQAHGIGYDRDWDNAVYQGRN